MRPAIARLRWPSRVGAVARSSISSRSPCDSTRPTPSLPHHSANGLPSTPCTHEPPRSSGAPSESSVQVRPPMRLRASSTVTAKSGSCSSRAATRPAMPAPTTITRSPLAVPIDHEPVMAEPARAASSCRRTARRPPPPTRRDRRRARRHRQARACRPTSPPGRPGTESSTTMQSNGCTFIVDRGVKEEIGKRLATRHLARAEDAAVEQSHRPVRPRVKRIFSGEPELATQVVETVLLQRQRSPPSRRRPAAAARRESSGR